MFFHQAPQQSRAKGRNWKQRKELQEREKKNTKSAAQRERKGGRRGGELDGCGGEEGNSHGLHARHSNAFPAICILANANHQKQGLGITSETLSACLLPSVFLFWRDFYYLKLLHQQTLYLR